jgi:hypothetical protein
MSEAADLGDRSGSSMLVSRGGDIRVSRSRESAHSHFRRGRRGSHGHSWRHRAGRNAQRKKAFFRDYAVTFLWLFIVAGGVLGFFLWG